MEFLDSATRLSGGASQGDLRSAISRAYYAVFLRARENLALAGAITPTRGRADHRLVVETLRSGGRPEGDELDKLRARRGRADYEIGVSISKGEANQAIALARHLWNRL